MARRVFFSFHYDDIMNANIVRKKSGQFKPSKGTRILRMLYFMGGSKD